MATDESAPGALEITEFQVKTLLDAGKNITQIAEFFGTNKWAIMRWFPELIAESGLTPGRPKKEIDPAVVEKLAEEGASTEDIAEAFEVSRDTIERRFMRELRIGRINLRNKIKNRQLTLALAGDRTMLIWVGKQYCGQRERIEHSGLEGGAIAIDVNRNQDLSKLSLEELKDLADTLRKITVQTTVPALPNPDGEPLAPAAEPPDPGDAL